MRLGWQALPWLIALEACSPVRNYQEAARSLRFTLERVQPRLKLAFPLDRSTLAFQITLAVDNPSTVPFHVRGFEGELGLEAPNGAHPIGHVGLLKALDLPPGGRADLTVEVSFACRDIREQWDALQGALGPEALGAWNLEGSLKLDAYGLSWQMPVKTRHTFGGAP